MVKHGSLSLHRLNFECQLQQDMEWSPVISTALLVLPDLVDHVRAVPLLADCLLTLGQAADDEIQVNALNSQHKQIRTSTDYSMKCILSGDMASRAGCSIQREHSEWRLHH